MGLNLAIDLGNSSTKVYLFDGERLVESVRYDAFEASDIESLFTHYNISNCIISSVKGDERALTAAIEQYCNNVIVLSHTTPMPMKIGYSTPHTLGRDRIAAAVGAMCDNEGKNVLIIDAGTAITLDVVDASGVYLGGNISPGLSTRFKSLNDFTRRLPLIDVNGEVPLIGYSTETAIRSGVVFGMVAEINEFIRLVGDKMPDLVVYVTGGDAKYLAKQIKSRIFEDENLLAKGLNRILLYNNENNK